MAIQGLGQETAEKQLPSALDYVGIFQQAVEAYKQSNGRKVAQQVALNSCVAEYNRGIKVKKYRVDTLKRKLLTNLLKVPQASLDILSEHYDLHRHSCSGLLLYMFMSAVSSANLCGFSSSNHSYCIPSGSKLLKLFKLQTTELFEKEKIQPLNWKQHKLRSFITKLAKILQVSCFIELMIWTPVDAMGVWRPASRSRSPPGISGFRRWSASDDDTSDSETSGSSTPETLYLNSNDMSMWLVKILLHMQCIAQ